MYFSIGWPRVINCSYKNIRKISCDRVKILFTILTDDTLAIWYTKVSAVRVKCIAPALRFKCKQSLGCIIITSIQAHDLPFLFFKPCVPIAAKVRSLQCLEKHGQNAAVEWKPDSSMLLVVTTTGTLFMYTLIVSDAPKGVYNQNDSPFSNLRRDSAELFLKETIPSLRLSLVR